MWLNDLQALSLQTTRWFTPRPRGRAPEPRCFHAAVSLLGSRRLLVFGGNNGGLSFGDVHVLDMPGAF